MTRHLRVLVGPYRVARDFAAARGLQEHEYLIVTRAHQLAKLDPLLVGSIVRLPGLAERFAKDIRDEVDRITALFPEIIAA